MLSKCFTFTAVVLALGLLIGCSSSLKSLAYPKQDEIIGAIQTEPPRFYGILTFDKDWEEWDKSDIYFPVKLTWNVPTGITWDFKTPKNGPAVLTMFYQDGKPICYGAVVNAQIRHGGKMFLIEVVDTVVIVKNQ